MTPPGDEGLVEVVVPVHNEAAVVEHNIERLCLHLEGHFPRRWQVVVVDNASTDGTWEVLTALGERLPGVDVRHIDGKGRGRALRAAWSASQADVLCYMDVDLSTNLDSFPALVAPLLAGAGDLAIGTRLAPGSRVRRRIVREIVSRGYNLLVHALFGARFSDAQCGFKAGRAQVVHRLLPLVGDNHWFFDTELLLMAERNGYRIHEVPVDWIEDLDSRVALGDTILKDLAGLWRVRRSFWRGGGRLPDRLPDAQEALVAGRL